MHVIVGAGALCAFWLCVLALLKCGSRCRADTQASRKTPKGCCSGESYPRAITACQESQSVSKAARGGGNVADY